MSNSTEGAGPALAAHSKDASTPGHNPASEATGKVPNSRNEGGEAAQHLLQQAEDFVRAQPHFAESTFAEFLLQQPFRIRHE